MAKFRFEFKDDDFTLGNCYECPLGYWIETYGEIDSVRLCVLNYRHDECPLMIVE